MAPRPDILVLGRLVGRPRVLLRRVALTSKGRMRGRRKPSSPHSRDALYLIDSKASCRVSSPGEPVESRWKEDGKKEGRTGEDFCIGLGREDYLVRAPFST